MHVTDLPPQAESRSITPVEILFWLLLPAGLLAWLVLFPPHLLDLALQRLIWKSFSEAWLNTYLTEFWLHQLPKFISIAAYAVLLLLLIRSFVREKRHASANAQWSRLMRGRMLYALLAGALSVIAVWWLKKTTGVSCPWSIEEFGGSAELTNPAFPLGFRPGVCWPSGAAGSGFCLLPFFFMLRGFGKKVSILAFAAPLLLGLTAGIGRMLAGAHFLSHVVDAFLVDWLISGALYVLIFCRRGFLKAFALLFMGSGRTKEEEEMGVTGRRTAVRPPFAVLIFGLGLWWAFVFDAPMLLKLLAPKGAASLSSAALALESGIAFALVGASLAALLSLFPRMIFRALLVFLNILGAVSFAAAFLYGTAMTPDMVRNLIATDPAEAAGYISVRSVFVFLWALIPPLWLSLRGNAAPALTLRPGKTALLKALGLRLGGVLLPAAAGVLLIALNFQAFSSAMRNDKTLRYQITPVNVVYSTISTFAADESPDAKRMRLVTDPAPKAAIQVRRPTLFVFVVGETARAANWGLNGYARDTTPELSKIKLINFPKVTSCGTSTDVSLPCMMSRIGRSNYDRDRILSEESLPALLERAGMNVLWVDNQSGCKGTCEGIPTREAFCPDGRCRDDDVLIRELEREIPKLPADRPTVLFLHMIGSHGPAYSERSPEAAKAFEPECRSADLGSCSREEVVNAYDNSIRETDRVLAGLIRRLEARSARLDSALLYVSDHGESLGESGLYLHGAPWWMAPSEQTQVPMIFWMSDGFARTFRLDTQYILARSREPLSHENLWSSVLGILWIESRTLRPEYDFSGRSR